MNKQSIAISGAMRTGCPAIGRYLRVMLLASLPIAFGCSPSANTDGDIPSPNGADAQQVSQVAGAITIQVTVATVKRMTLAEQLNVPGIAEAFRKATIAAETSGRIVNRNVEPGAIVSADQQLLSIDDLRARLSVQEASARARAASVALASAVSELARGRDLSKEKYISQDQLDQLEFAVQSAEANLEAAKAATDNAQRTLSDTRIRAPFDGTVERIFVHQGDYVANGTPLVELADFSRIRVIAGVTASEAGLLSTTAKPAVTFNDLSIGALSGSIQSIGQVTDSAAGTYPVEIWIDRPAEVVIREGMLATIALPYRAAVQSLAIPASSILRKNGQTYAYRMVTDNDARIARLTAIDVGRSSSEFVEVLQGLKAGDTVITQGMFALRDGAHVKPVTNAGN